MFVLSKTRIAKRLAALFACLIVVMLGVFFAVKQNKVEKTSAATPDGANVTINYTGSIDSQGEWPGWDGVLHSPRFSVKYGSMTTTGFCINAWLGVVDNGSSIKANKTNNDAIKLAIYIYTVSNDVTDEIMSQMGISRDDAGFARIHAIVSYINDPETTKNGYNEDTRPGWNAKMAWVEQQTAAINSYISNNADVWLMAKNYQLYTLDSSATVDQNKQNIAWIESNATYGSISVQKQDYDSSSNVPQGNASLANIHFQVLNNSGSRIYNPYNNTFYNNGAVVAEGNTNASGTAIFSNLLTGINYKVVETTTGSTNASYTINNSDVGTVMLTTSGQTFTVKNQVKRGNVTLNKVDKETGSCSVKTGDLSFNGTKFQIINNSTNPIYINGASYAKDSVVATKTFGASTCSVTFEDLPYGSYIIKEIAAGKGYVVNQTPITVTIPTNNNYEIETTVQNQPIRGDVKFVKMNSTSNEPMPNTLFSISSLDEDSNIKETHIVVSDENGVVNTSSSFALHSNHTNGYDALYGFNGSITFLGYGTWFGLDSRGNSLPVSDSVGALPYGTYLIQELECDATRFCTNIINQKVKVEITSNNQIVDLGDWNNTCASFKLETTATDLADNDSYIEENDEVTIKDTIDYCVKENMDFVIKGVLMDKETSEPLLINGEKVENEIEINSETACGTTEMLFTFDATNLGGKELVVFEGLYYENELVISHEDLDDDSQTIYVISLTTYAKNKETGDKILPLDQDVIIDDLVEYCVIPGQKYKIKGVLMGKNTEKEALINGESVEREVILETEEACGELTMEYPINTTGLGGAELVIFESLYLVEENSEGDEEEYEILSHRDIENKNETVQVELPVPDTGHMTIQKDSGVGGNNTILFIIATITVSLGGYVVVRMLSRRSFLNRR